MRKYCLHKKEHRGGVYYNKLLWLLAFIALLFTYSCKHNNPSDNTGGEKQDEVLVNVEKDSHVKIAPSSFKVTKNVAMGVSELKAKMPTLQFETGYELDKITLDNISGKEIKDSAKHKFMGASTIFISSKLVANSENVKLISLKVDEVSKPITQNMDFAKTSKQAVKVEYTVTPADAIVTCTSEDGKSSYASNLWTLGENGKKILKINVKKGSEESNYIITIEKVAEGTVFLTEVSVGDEKKTGVDVASEMTFKEIDKGVVKVKVTCSDESAKVAFGDEPVKDEKEFDWFLISGENTLKVKIEKSGKSTVYTLKISTTAIPIHVIYVLNGISMGAIPGGFKAKVENGEKPTFTSKGSHLFITLKIVGNTQKILCNEKTLTARQDGGFWIVEHTVPLTTEEKDINITVIPTLADAVSSTIKMLNFKAKGSGEKEKIEPKLAVNGNTKWSKEEFLDKLTSATPPLYKVFKSPAKVKISISEYEKLFLIQDVKINGESLTFTKDVTTYSGEKGIDVDGTPTTITVQFISKNESIVDSLTWKFQVQTGGEKPTPEGVRLISINDQGNTEDPLPKSLVDHLEDNSNPLYTFDGSKAKVVIGTFVKDLIDTVEFKLDGLQKANITVDQTKSPYGATYEYEISDMNPHDAEIIMVPKDSENYGNLIFKFKLQRSGQNPKLPNGKMTVFTVKEKQKFQLPKELTQHLTDGSNPEYEIDGKYASITVGTQDKGTYERIEKVKFSLDGNVLSEVPMNEVPGVYNSSYVAFNNFLLPDKSASHLVKIEFIPKIPTEYSSLIYTFKLKSNGNVEKLNVTCGVDGKVQPNGASVKVTGETATILVQAKADILAKVEIGLKGKEKTCRIIKLNNGMLDFYNAQGMVLVVGSDGNESEKIVSIKLTAKDHEAYEDGVYEYKITGTKILANNCNFVENEKGVLVFSDVKYKTGLTSDYLYDYGAESVSLEAYTISPRAKVKYQIVDLEGKPYNGSSEAEMTRDSEGLPIHMVNDIPLFLDKPTRIKAWVIAEDGTVASNKHGIWHKIYNPIALKWSYEQKNKGAEFEHMAYDVILLEKSKIHDNKVYLAFAPWDKESGYLAVDNGKPTYQDNFVSEPIDKFGDEKQWYKTVINVADLTKTTNPFPELEAVLPMQKLVSGSYVDCFTYRVKIKLK